MRCKRDGVEVLIISFDFSCLVSDCFPIPGTVLPTSPSRDLSRDFVSDDLVLVSDDFVGESVLDESDSDVDDS